MADANTAWAVMEWFQVLGIGAVAGVIGQCIRVVVGLKKVNDTASATASSVGDLIQPGRLVVSLVIGAIAGALASTMILTNLSKVTPQEFFALAAAGYAGADFIEGFMNRVVPTGASAVLAQQDGAVG